MPNVETVEAAPEPAAFSEVAFGALALLPVQEIGEEREFGLLAVDPSSVTLGGHFASAAGHVWQVVGARIEEPGIVRVELRRVD